MSTLNVMKENSEILEKVKKQLKRLKKEHDNKCVSALIRYWLDAIIKHINTILKFEYVLYYKLNKDVVVHFIRDDSAHIWEPVETYEKTIESTEPLDKIKSVIQKYCGSLSICDKVFKGFCNVPCYWSIDNKCKSIEYIEKLFQRVMKKYKDDDYKKCLETGLVLFKICRDLNIHIEYPN